VLISQADLMPWNGCPIRAEAISQWSRDYRHTWPYNKSYAAVSPSVQNFYASAFKTMKNIWMWMSKLIIQAGSKNDRFRTDSVEEARRARATRTMVSSSQ
jgi:hypothetical protein